MHLYNSLTQQAEPFHFPEGPILIYVCGITPYDTTHLGHAFTYSVADILIRYLEYQNRQVQYVQNVTDIDDDILKRAAEVGQSWWELGNQWTLHFIEDMQTLNIRPPEHFPRASDVIPQIIAMVERLIKADLAYVAGGSVYYRVESYPAFGQLSQLPRTEMLDIANERGNRPDDPNKENPLDFVLWQAHAPGEPSWESPWGAGRPGWHIECSTLISHFLGETIDIHMGGSDLLFPHHECEIAQIEPLSRQKPFVRHWLHTAMVEHENEKMSKSLGNLVMARDLLQTYSADSLRLYMASHHYRTPWSYHEDDLAHAASLSSRFTDAVVAPSGHQGPEVDAESAVRAFEQALDNDLDTPNAISAMDMLAAIILDSMQAARPCANAQAALRRMAGVFGLTLDQGTPEERTINGWDQHKAQFQQQPSRTRAN
jgi:L-cysteine:1D-myo-inositol 2-amino-2-deoxy-alpha-D-glucopyranoside ligase